MRRCEGRFRAWLATYSVDVQASKARPKGCKSVSSMGRRLRRAESGRPGVA
jgi:hypothetical protein